MPLTNQEVFSAAINMCWRWNNSLAASKVSMVLFSDAQLLKYPESMCFHLWTKFPIYSFLLLVLITYISSCFPCCWYLHSIKIAIYTTFIYTIWAHYNLLSYSFIVWLQMGVCTATVHISNINMALSISPAWVNLFQYCPLILFHIDACIIWCLLHTIYLCMWAFKFEL